MKVDINISWGQVLTVIFVGLLSMSFGYMLPKEGNSLNQGDMNFIGEMNYLSGHCERVGLESGVIISDINGIKVGEPICVERNEI